MIHFVPLAVIIILNEVLLYIKTHVSHDDSYAGMYIMHKKKSVKEYERIYLGRLVAGQYKQILGGAGCFSGVQISVYIFLWDLMDVVVHQQIIPQVILPLLHFFVLAPVQKYSAGSIQLMVVCL